MDNRVDALRGGFLIDVTDIAETVGVRFPVAFSAALYNHPEFDLRNRIGHIRWILRAGLWSELSGEVGEFTYGVLVDNRGWLGLVNVRVVVERSPGGRGVVATFFERGETYGFRGPAASFYEN